MRRVLGWVAVCQIRKPCSQARISGIFKIYVSHRKVEPEPVPVPVKRTKRSATALVAGRVKSSLRRRPGPFCGSLLAWIFDRQHMFGLRLGLAQSSVYLGTVNMDEDEAVSSWSTGKKQQPHSRFLRPCPDHLGSILFAVHWHSATGPSPRTGTSNSTSDATATVRETVKKRGNYWCWSPWPETELHVGLI